MTETEYQQRTKRPDYAADTVKPDGYLIVCPECEDRHEAESIVHYPCPNCGNWVSPSI